MSYFPFSPADGEASGSAPKKRKQGRSPPSSDDDVPNLEDIPFHVSGKGERVPLSDMFSVFVRAVERTERSRAPNAALQRLFAVYDKDEQVAEVLLQIDKSHLKRLTIQQIGVEQAFQRKGIGRRIVRALKLASVVKFRVAHIQSTLGDEIRALAKSEFFHPSQSGSFDYLWEPPTVEQSEPITWENWALELSWASNCSSPNTPWTSVGFDSKEVKSVEPMVKSQLSMMKGRIRGLEAFESRARWFKPETNLEKISERLGIPKNTLADYRRDKQCYAVSSAFCDKYGCRNTTTPFMFVVNGWSVTPSLPIPLQHACLCAVTERGELFPFDLVRREPLYLYGVLLRRDFEKALTRVETYSRECAAEFVLDGLNYLQRRAREEEELGQVLERLNTK